MSLVAYCQVPIAYRVLPIAYCLGSVYSMYRSYGTYNMYRSYSMYVRKVRGGMYSGT